MVVDELPARGGVIESWLAGFSGFNGGIRNACQRIGPLKSPRRRHCRCADTVQYSTDDMARMRGAIFGTVPGVLYLPIFRPSSSNSSSGVRVQLVELVNNKS